MNRSARPYRAYPGNVHRLPPPDANAVRRHWRELAAAALAIGNRALETDGARVGAALDFRHDLARAPAFPLPAADAAVGVVLRTFREVFSALLGSATAERRALLAPLAIAAAKAVDGLLDEEIAPHLALSRRIAGDLEED